MMTRRPHRGTELRRLRAVRADIRVHRDPHPRWRIRVAAHAGESRAKVVYSQANMGMGVAFQNVEERYREVLQKWMAKVQP